MTTQTMPAGGADLAAMFPDEVVTKCPVRDITLPGGAGTLALITLDNGFDHTRPNTFGPNSLAALRTAVEGIAARAAAGEIVAAAVTGKPFIFAVGADLSGVPVKRVQITVYSISGVLSAIAGLVLDHQLDRVVDLLRCNNWRPVARIDAGIAA